MKKSIVLATTVAAVLTSGVASAELSANAGIFSNYIWRGVTQTDDSSAGQGGIDWGNDSGLYAGTWVSTLGAGNGYEIDLYAGFAGEAGSLGYDLGVVTYQVPVSPEFNFTEVYLSGTASIVTISLNYTVDAASGNENDAFDSGDLYVYGVLNFPAGKTDMSIYAGSYMFENDGKAGVGEIDYSNVGASVSKDGFAFAVDKNDIDDPADPSADNVRFTVSYTKDFEL